jgi:DNA primase
MDVISLHQCGVVNAVASLGTALTESQGRVLKKYAEEIIISYDADTAGQTATMRGLDLLNDIGCNVKVLIVPKGKDPDEYVRNNGSEGFKKLINETLPLVEYKIKVLKEQINTDTTEGEIKLRNGIVDLLVKTDNHIEREMYVKKFSKDYSISEESLLGEINRRLKPRTSYKQTVVKLNDYKTKTTKGTNDNNDSKLDNYEKMILALLCIDNSTFKTIKDKITIDDFENEDNKKTAAFIFEKLLNKKDIFTGELMNFLVGEQANDFARIINEECNYEDNNKAVLDIIKKMQLYKLEKRRKQILEILNNKDIQAEGDVEKLKLELGSITIKMRKNI